MYRALFLLALFVPFSVHAAPFIGPPSQAQVEVARGSIASVTSCGGGAQRFAFQSGVQMVFDPLLTITYPRGLTPQTGADSFVVLAGNVSCGSGQGRLAIYLAPSQLVDRAGELHPPTAEDPGSQRDGGIADFGSGLLNQARDFLSNLLRPPTAAPSPSTQPGQSSAVSLAQRLATCPTIFGGRVPNVIQCNGGIVFIPALAGAPYAGPLTWVPGAVVQPYAVNMEGPPIPSQCIIGCYGPPVPCIIGTTLVGVGPQILYYGSSAPGCALGVQAPTPAPAQQQPSDQQVQCYGGAVSTPAQKLAAEKAIRDELAKCNVTVSSSKTNGAACAFGQNGLNAGCTDVSGLRCEAITGICDIAKKCPLRITGGSESGHQGHRSGKEVDIAVDADCIARNFQALDSTGCRYRDPATGTTFRNETVCRADRTTGPHFHICIGGRCY